MAVYQNNVLTERAIYGSSRLGQLDSASAPGYRRVGLKRYELSNHLGNVLAVVSDRIRMRTDSTWTQVLSRTDYYPFGLEMTGRTESATYRYGFNGKEKDPSGQWSNQTHYDYGFRIYNPTIGKFLSVDPLTKEFPWNSTYAFAENDVIRSIDLEGAEKYIVIVNKSWGENKQQLITYDKVALSIEGPLGGGVAVKLNMFGETKYFYGDLAKDDKDFIKFYEGNGIPGHPFERYDDQYGKATIGYGHLMSESDKSIWPITASNNPFVVGSKISEFDADELFLKDYISHKKMALEAINIDGLNRFQKDAVIDFGYNIKNAKTRIGAFSMDKGGRNFLEYMKGGSGLEKRRLGEAVLWEEGDYIKFDPLKAKESIQSVNNQINEKEK
jgi:RHS repeat-associated protein